MLKCMLTIVCLLFLVSMVMAKKGTSTVPSTRKLTIKELDSSEIKKIDKYNSTRMRFALDPIHYDRELMKFAQSQAEKMVVSKSLFAPKFKTDKSYHGYAFNVKGVAGKSYVGKKICFDNILGGKKSEIGDIKIKCNDEELDWREDFAVGFGRKYDAKKMIYFVKIFFSQQTREDEKEKKQDEKEKEEDENTTTAAPASKTTTTATTSAKTITQALSTTSTKSAAVSATTQLKTESVTTVPTPEISKLTPDDSINLSDLDRSKLHDDDSLFLNILNSLKKSEKPANKTSV